MSCGIGPHCGAVAEEVVAENAPEEVMPFGERELAAITTGLSTLQADIDLLKIGMKRDMEGHIEAVKERCCALEEHVTRLEDEVKDLKASQNARGDNTPRQGAGHTKSEGTLTTLTKETSLHNAHSRGSEESNVVHNPHTRGSQELPIRATVRKSILNLKKSQGRIASLKYDLRETIWDLLLFVRLDTIFISDEICVCIIAVLNFVIQCLFIALVGNSMLDSGFDFTDEEVVTYLLDWRVKFAHAPKYADEVTSTPLAQAVCSLESSSLLNMEGTQQALLFRTISEYLTPLGGFKSGDILCMLVILLWSFTCIQEFMAIRKLFQAVWLNVYDSGSNTLHGFSRLLSARSSIVMEEPILVVGMDNDVAQKSVVLTLSLWRACAVTFCSILPRSCILVALAYVGVRFLIITIELEELILNAVALEVILHVDEMMYDLFAPQLCKRVLSKAHPFRLPKESIAVGRTVPYLKIFAAAALLGLIRGFLLEPILKNLEAAENVMCGGKLDFVFVELENGPVLAGIPKDKVTIDRTFYNYRAVLQRTGLSVAESRDLEGSDLWYLDSDATAAMFPIQNVQVARDYDALTMADLALGADFVRYSVMCITDKSWSSAVNGSHNAIEKALAQTTGVANHTCQYLRDLGFCNQNTHAGSVQRFFCPFTCGIHNASSGLAYVQPTQGVPYVHCNLPMGLQLESLPCENLPMSHPAFQVYANSIQSGLEFVMGQASLGNQTWLDRANQYMFGDIAVLGCGYAPMPLRNYSNPSTGIPIAINLVLCDPGRIEEFGGQFRSLRYLCPVACGCSTTVKRKYISDGKPWDRAIGFKENCAKACFD